MKIVGIYIVALLIVGCNQVSTYKRPVVVKDSIVASIIKKDVQDTSNQIKAVTYKYALKIWQVNDSLRIQFKSGNKYSNIQFYCGSPSDNYIPCDGMLVTNNDSKINFNYKDYYIYHDSILLLPNLMVEKYFSLWVVNLYSGKFIENKDSNAGGYAYSSCYLGFIFNPVNGYLIRGNEVDANNNEEIMSIFKISSTDIKYIRDFGIEVKDRTYCDDVLLKQIIDRANKK